MITCPKCNHVEYEGTLFCSECGARLWDDPAADSTANLDSKTLREMEQHTVIVPGRTTLSKGKIAFRVHGTTDQILLEGKTEYLVGRRDPKHNIVPDLDLSAYNGQKQGVSRRHAVVRRDERGLLIIDLGSANGTGVNGTTLTANEPFRLRDGDEIRLGKLAMNIYFLAE